VNHLITVDHRVVTHGDTGQALAVTSWPNAGAARMYAARIANLVGGTVDDQTLTAVTV
jgi:hypothetical protein